MQISRAQPPALLRCTAAMREPLPDARAGARREPSTQRLFGRPYFDGRALPKRLGTEGLGASFGCLGFFFSLRRSLLPMVDLDSFLPVDLECLCGVRRF
jgi:hypothetical protein